jgi:hypothetical protein
VAAPSAFSQDRPETSKETLMQFIKRKDSAVAETPASATAGTRRKFFSRAASNR